jgi:alpha/beta hydrolase fold
MRPPLPRSATSPHTLFGRARERRLYRGERAKRQEPRRGSNSARRRWAALPPPPAVGDNAAMQTESPKPEGANMKSVVSLSSLVVLLGLAPAVSAQQPSPKLPEGTKVFRNLEYVQGGHERQKLDLYVPEKADGPLPVIVWVHGGGWMGGSKEGGGPTLPFVGKGYAVAAINYRLSQHAPFPAQIEDCKAAIRWLRANAKPYNLAPEHIGVWGASADGHLVPKGSKVWQAPLAHKAGAYRRSQDSLGRPRYARRADKPLRAYFCSVFQSGGTGWPHWAGPRPTSRPQGPPGAVSDSRSPMRVETKAS